MNIQAVVWDFDGVIIDSEEGHIDAEIETFKKYGVSITPSIAKEYIGIKIENYFGDIAKRFKSDLPLDEAIAKHCNTLIRYYSEIFPLVPHITEVLNTLRGKYKMGLATSREKALAEMALKRFSLHSYFDALVFKEDVIRGKPDPEPFLKILSLLNVEPQDSVVIEDSLSGLKAAKGAGAYVIVRTASYNSHLDFSSADFVIEDLREILKLIGSGSV
jgi:HAD superfamily hydrolase (TIGR01509 family)